MTALRPAMTPRPWPDNRHPTTEEFLPWLLDQTTQAQTWILERLRADAERGWACDQQEHAQEIDALKRRVLLLTTGAGHCSVCGGEARKLGHGQGWHHLVAADAVMCASASAEFVPARQAART